jgi:hypothetical protein
MTFPLFLVVSLLRCQLYSITSFPQMMGLLWTALRGVTLFIRILENITESIFRILTGFETMQTNWTCTSAAWHNFKSGLSVGRTQALIFRNSQSAKQFSARSLLTSGYLAVHTLLVSFPPLPGSPRRKRVDTNLGEHSWRRQLNGRLAALGNP